MSVLFSSVLRSIAIPIVVIVILQTSFIGPKGATLAVCMTLTLVNIYSLFWQFIKIIPNLIMLKGRKTMMLFIRIAFEIFSPIGFWIYYLQHFS